jgi:hypothetical protein
MGEPSPDNVFIVFLLVARVAWAFEQFLFFGRHALVLIVFARVSRHSR